MTKLEAYNTVLAGATCGFELCLRMRHWAELRQLDLDWTPFAFDLD